MEPGGRLPSSRIGRDMGKNVTQVGQGVAAQAAAVMALQALAPDFASFANAPDIGAAIASELLRLGAPPPQEDASLFDRFIAPQLERLATPVNTSCSHENPFCYDSKVTDQQIVSGMTTSLVVGACCLLLFLYLREKCTSYQARLFLPEVLIKPPQYSGSCLYRLWAWLIPVFTISDAELVKTAGLDALMFHRAITFGVLFFAPVTLVSCLILLPIYINSSRTASEQLAITTFSQLTISNVKSKGAGLWAPFVFVYIVLFYAFWLLTIFYKEYVTLHQHYMVKGEDVVNEWSMAFLGRRNLMDRVRKLPNIKESARHAARTRYKAVQDYAEWLNRATVYGPDAPGPAVDHIAPISKYEQLEDNDIYRGRARFYKWWDTTTTLVSEGVTHTISAKPPVPFRKVVTTTNQKGETVSVNAAQYVVLVRDVPPTKTAKVPSRLMSLPSLVGKAPSTVLGAVLRTILILCAGPMSEHLVRSFENQVDLAAEQEAVVPEEVLPDPKLANDPVTNLLHKKLTTKSISMKPMHHRDPQPDEPPTTFFGLRRSSAPVLANITRPLSHLLRPLQDNRNNDRHSYAMSRGVDLQEVQVTPGLASVDEGVEPATPLDALHSLKRSWTKTAKGARRAAHAFHAVRGGVASPRSSGEPAPDSSPRTAGSEGPVSGQTDNSSGSPLGAGGPGPRGLSPVGLSPTGPHRLGRVSMVAPIGAGSAPVSPRDEDADQTQAPGSGVPRGGKNAGMRDYVGPRQVARKKDKHQPRLFASGTPAGRGVLLRQRSMSGPMPEIPPLELSTGAGNVGGRAAVPELPSRASWGADEATREVSMFEPVPGPGDALAQMAAVGPLFQASWTGGSPMVRVPPTPLLPSRPIRSRSSGLSSRGSNLATMAEDEEGEEGEETVHGDPGGGDGVLRLRGGAGGSDEDESPKAPAGLGAQPVHRTPPVNLVHIPLSAQQSPEDANERSELPSVQSPFASFATQESGSSGGAMQAGVQDGLGGLSNEAQGAAWGLANGAAGREAGDEQAVGGGNRDAGHVPGLVGHGEAGVGQRGPDAAEGKLAVGRVESLEGNPASGSDVLPRLGGEGTQSDTQQLPGWEGPKARSPAGRPSSPGTALGSLPSGIPLTPRGATPEVMVPRPTPVEPPTPHETSGAQASGPPGTPRNGGATAAPAPPVRLPTRSRVYGWGDPNAATPMMAWPPGGRHSRSQSFVAPPNPTGAAAAGKRTSEEEEFYEPAADISEGGFDSQADTAMPEGGGWSLLRRFVGWSSKQYDGQDPLAEEDAPGKEEPEEVVPWDEHESLGGEALVNAVFQKLFPNNYTHALPVRNHKAIDILLFEWNDLYGYLEHAEALYEASGCRRRPRHRQHFGLWGPKVDSINYYASQIRQLENAILAEQQVVLQDTSDTTSYFVFFNSQSAAATAAQCELFPEGSEQQFRVHRAPGPEEVNWATLWLTKGERFRDNVFACMLLTFFIILPIGLFTGAFQNINYVICNSPQAKDHWYCTTNNLLKGIVTGFLPPIILMLWQNLVMPLMIYRGVMLLRKDVSLSGMDRRIFTLFFTWDVFNVMLGAVLGGSTLQTIPRALEDPGKIYNLIGVALASSSNFFINYIMVQAFLTMPYRLAMPTVMPMFDFARWIHLLPAPRTRRQRTEYLHPPFNIRLGREVGGNIMLIYVMALSYAAVSPMILPFTLLFFLENWLVWRYQILYTFERAYESGGIMWHQTFQSLLWCLFIFAFFTGCVLITNDGFYQGGIMVVTAPLLIWRFYSYMQGRFGKGRHSAPLLLASDGPKAHVDPAMYIAPALRSGAAGWFPEYGKAWENWCCPAYYP